MVGYAKAVWRGSPNHYQGRNGYKVTHITLHIMVGSLQGTDTVFQRSSYRASSTYGVGTDGTVYQWVDEINGAWCDANMASDCSGISIEHAGGIAGIAPTDAEYEASAQLCADIARRYGWTKLWHDETGNRTGNIVLHREVPGTDHAGCPDRAVNGLDVARVINRANQILNNQGGTDMSCALMIRDDDTGVIYYWSPETGRIGLGHPDQMKVLDAAGVKLIHSSKKAPWAARADQISGYVQAKTTAYEKAQTAALEALAKSVGANPSDITKTVSEAVNAALKNLTVTLTNKEA